MICSPSNNEAKSNTVDESTPLKKYIPTFAENAEKKQRRDERRK